MAREVAHELRHPVQTIVSLDAVHALLRDWPTAEREKQIQEEAIREVSDALSLANEVLLTIPLGNEPIESAEPANAEVPASFETGTLVAGAGFEPTTSGL